MAERLSLMTLRLVARRSSRVCGLAVAVACGGVSPEPSADASVDDPTANSCGTATCDSGFFVTLVAGGGGLAAGRYDVTATADGREIENCAFELGADDIACGGDPPCVLNDECDADFIFIVPPHTIRLRLLATEAVIELQVRHRGEVRIAEPLAPSYEEYYPNGSDCEPVCSRGDATVYF